MMIVLFSMSVNEIFGNSDPIFNIFIFNFVNIVKVDKRPNKPHRNQYECKEN